ncbi:MAG: 2-hydroxyacyl-CoA dehydratase [Armatimonadetes bacterium]|nr:2-hydroxyacyl-CoA dehydratase [Armatimonadota bacterium]
MTIQIAEAVAVEPIVERCRHLAEDLSLQAVEEWKARHPGGRAVGCYPVYCPVELIHAAGMLPVGVLGGGNQVEIAHADARFQSFICSIVKSTLELGLTGRLQVLDGMIFHSICDPARNLASVFVRNFPHQVVEYIHFPQNLASPRAVHYLAAEYRRVLASLESLAGRPATAADLSESIQVYNRSRALIRALYRLRAQRPECLATAELYPLVRAGTVLPPEEHAALMEDALHAVEQRAARPKDRIRVVVEGSFCEQPPLELVSALEEAGCYLVDDDFLLGWRWFVDDVPVEDGDPVRGLARAYVDGAVHCATRHDLRLPKTAHLLEKVRDLQADAVIFLAAKFCEPALFDYVLVRRALEEAGIPHVFLEFEEKMWNFEKMRTEVETFVESMLF